MILLLTRDRAVELLQGKREYLHAEFGVSKIGVFGSVARDQADKSSDVDIVVEFDRPIGFRFIELADYLENLLGCKADILTPAGIEAIQRLKSVGGIAHGFSNASCKRKKRDAGYCSSAVSKCFACD